MPGPKRRTKGTPTCPASRSRPRSSGAPSQRCGRACVVVIGLLRPQHAGEGLALNAPRVFVADVGLEFRVELVGLTLACGEQRVIVGERLGKLGLRESQVKFGARTGSDGQQIMRCRFGPRATGRDRLLLPVHDVIVKCSLGMRRALGAENAREIALVLAE